VTKTKSFSVRSSPPGCPPLIHSMRRATLRSGLMLNCTLVTRVSYWKATPCCFSQGDHREDEGLVLVEPGVHDSGQIRLSVDVVEEA